MHVAPVLHLLSLVILLFAGFMLVPLAVSIGLDDAAQRAHNLGLLVTLGSGAALWAATRKLARELRVRDGFLLVALVWTVLPAFATLPLMLHLPQLSFTDAYFEAVSGLTASGATVLSGLDQLPPSINVWRHFMIWVGGMGIIVLTVAVLPLLGVGGSQIYKAETPGPMKDSKLTPRITETAKGLYIVYVGITLACILGYRWAGMTWFDAFCHAFSTMGLGGFSTHDQSFGYFNSVAIESVAIFFMLVAGINFGTHFLAWRRLSLRPYSVDPEAGMFLAVTVGSCLLIATYLLGNRIYPDYFTALRYAAFNVVSVATTTGYANTDFNLWPVFAPLWMLFLAGFCTCSGSTGGGVKMVRARILFQQIFRELLRIIHPKVYSPVKLSGQSIENNVVFAVLVFGFVYISSISALTLVLSASGLDAITAFSAIVACINNAGPGLGQVGPSTTYAVLNDFQTWVCSFAMLLGRLELFTLLVLLTPAFWRK